MLHPQPLHYFFIEEMWEKLNGWTLCLLLFMKRAKATGLLKTRLSEDKRDSAGHSRLQRRVGPQDLRWDSTTRGKTSLEGHLPLPNHSCAQKGRALIIRCWNSVPERIRAAVRRRREEGALLRLRTGAERGPALPAKVTARESRGALEAWLPACSRELVRHGGKEGGAGRGAPC